MSQTKDSKLNELVVKYNGYAPASKKLTETSTFVGGGVAVGTTRVIADFSCEVFTSQDGVNHPWLAAIFTDGTKVSLRSLMGLPSMEGFSKNAAKVTEYTGEVLPNGEKATAERTVTATATINFDDRYKPSTWCVNDFLNTEAETLKGASVTYHGEALREYTVRKPFGNQVPGAKAVISCSLWTVKKAAAPTAPTV